MIPCPTIRQWYESRLRQRTLRDLQSDSIDALDSKPQRKRQQQENRAMA